MIEAAIEGRVRGWAAERRLPESYLARWLGLAQIDCVALLKLVERLRMRTGQFLTAFELLEEIGVREDVSISSILARRELCRIVEGEGSAPGKARQLLEVLRAMRYPRLRLMVERLAKEVAALKLPANIRIILPTDLESDELRLELSAHGGGELGESLARLVDQQAALCRLADALGGSDEV